MDIEKLRILCNNKRLIITQHCIKRMMERSIEFFRRLSGAKSREINAEMQAKTPKLRFRHF